MSMNIKTRGVALRNPRKLNLARWLVVFLLAATVSLTGQTFNPTADTDNQSDVAAGTNATLNLSQWCNPYLLFNLSSVSGTVTNAKLRIYFPNSISAFTLTVSTTNTDTWTEGGTKPTKGSQITTKSVAAAGAGYIEVDITSHVQSKLSGNKIVSLALSNNLGTWSTINSRQASANKPQLVLTSSSVAVTGVTVSPTTTSINVGSTTTLTATVSPSNATNKTVSWSSSNTSVATVNSSGVVSGVAAGSATITVTTQDGGKTATCAVTVNAPSTITKYEAESATLSGVSIASSESGYSGTGYMDGNTLDATGDKITFTVNAASAGQYPLVIRFKNTCGVCEKYQNIKVNSGSDVNTRFNGTTTNWQDLNYGNVSLNAGNNTITISKSWGWTHIDYITVGTGGSTTVPVSGVSVSPTSASVAVNGTTTLTATVSPSNATNKTVSWSSSNTSIATVSSSGVVTGKAAGSATITVTTQDGGKTATCAVTVTSTPPPTGVMSGGANFWNIGWEGTTSFFKSGVNWSTTTDPWNPTLISELQAAKIKTLRFMDWNATNFSCVVNWSQRIPKTANHYNTDNKIPQFVDNYNSSTNTHTLVWNAATSYGVAYEWQIDLCNRVGADLWINIPATASADFQYQLANLIKNQLNSTLKAYIEWSNEVWNWGFASTIYARDQADALGISGVNVGAYCDPWRKYTVYASVRAFQQFENVFGANSSRLVKVIAGQVGYHWPGYDFNHMVAGDLACLANSTINPNGMTINAYAMAPYMGGQTISAQRSAITAEAQNMLWAKNSLNGTSIKLICYEGGADNYPDNGLLLTRNSEQEQLYIDYLNMLDDYVQGPFVQYTFYGGCWGLKNFAGESATNAPKWRGWNSYWANKSGVMDEEPEISTELAGKNEGMRMYPNPANGLMTIESDSEGATLCIVDVNGKVALRKIIEGRSLTISTSSLKPGVYFVHFDSQGNREIQKLMVK